MVIHYSSLSQIIPNRIGLVVSGPTVGEVGGVDGMVWRGREGRLSWADGRVGVRVGGWVGGCWRGGRFKFFFPIFTFFLEERFSSFFCGGRRRNGAASSL